MPHYAMMHNVLYEYSPRPSYFLPEEGVVPVSADADAPALPDAEAPAAPGIVDDPDHPPDIVLSADGASIRGRRCPPKGEQTPSELVHRPIKDPMYRRHNSFFNGQILPFGCGVHFKLAPTKIRYFQGVSPYEFRNLSGVSASSGGKVEWIILRCRP